MKNNTLIEKSKEFAIEIIKAFENSKISYALQSQVLRSGTSVGANIHEAHYAQSKADFISKFEIALKECYETEYWLEVLYKSGKIEKEKADSLLYKAQEIRRILIKSCTTAKQTKS